MIIFVIRNKLSKESFVGSTRNKLEDQWNKILCATKKNLDYPLYNSIKKYGEKVFEIEEWDYADTREELISLEKEAIKLFNAKSLRGYKTSEFNIKKLKPSKKICNNSENMYIDGGYVNESNLLKTRQIDNAIADYYDDSNDLDGEEPLLEEDLKNIDKQLHKKELKHNNIVKQDNKETKEKKVTSSNVARIQPQNKYKTNSTQTMAINYDTITPDSATEKLDKDQIKFITIVRQALCRHKKTISITNEEQYIKRINKLKAILHRLN